MITVRCARVCRPLSGGTRATALVLSIESSVSEEMNMADASARVQPEDSSFGYATGRGSPAYRAGSKHCHLSHIVKTALIAQFRRLRG